MALTLADRVRDTTATIGTGTITLSGTAPTGYQTFETGVGNGNTTYYTINSGNNWEVGIGTYSSTGPTLTRDTVLASSANGAKVDFPAGTKDVFVTYPAERSVYQDASGNVGLGVTPSAKLDVAGNIITRASSDILDTGVFSNVGYIQTYNNASGIAAIPMRFLTGTAERMRIDNSGNVGIGTSSPLAKFNVEGGNILLRGGVMDIGPTAGADGAGRISTARGGDGVSGILIFSTQNSSAAMVEAARIDGSGNVGIGTSSPSGYRLRVYGSNNNSLLIDNDTSQYTSAWFANNGTTKAVLVYNNGTSDFAVLNTTASGNVLLGTVGAERARIDSSGNLLVGTTAAGARLTLGFNTVNGDGVYAINNQNSSYYTLHANGSTGSGISGWANSTVLEAVPAGSGGLVLGAYSGNMIFQTGARTERMRIDSSGNVGIGTTAPSNQLSVAANITATISLDWTGDNAAKAWFSANHSTGEVRHATVTNYFPTFYSNNSERMRIDLSGNVGIGTTTPGAKLDVYGGLKTGNTVDIGLPDANNTIVNVGQGATGNKFAIIDFIGDTTYTDYGCRVGRYNNGANGTSEMQHRGTGALSLNAFDAGVILLQTQNTERMRVTSAGDVGIGTSSPGAKLDVQRAVSTTVRSRSTDTTSSYVGIVAAEHGSGSSLQLRAGNAYTVLMSTGASDPLLFSTNSTERARIDSSGNLLVGTTSQLASCKQSIVGGSNGVAVSVANGAVGSYMTNTSGTGDWQPFSFNVDGTSFTQVGSITITGGTTTNYNTSSDARLKENIAPADDAAALIDAIQVRKFDWKADGSHQRYGMVAQELLEVAPEAVSVPADEEAMMGVDYSKLVPMLVKEIQSLRARVAQLEGN